MFFKLQFTTAARARATAMAAVKEKQKIKKTEQLKYINENNFQAV